MKHDPNRPHRRTIRLRGWDYRSPGLYFVTICAFERQNLFQHQDFREIAVQALARIPTQEHARHVAMDESVVMPNHVHVIFEFTDYPAQAIGLAPTGQLGNAVRGSLGVVVGRYKTAVTTRINKLRQRTGLPVWQRGYYERIIRDEGELRSIRRYIQENPLRWAEDRDNLDGLLARMTYRP